MERIFGYDGAYSNRFEFHVGMMESFFNRGLHQWERQERAVPACSYYQPVCELQSRESLCERDSGAARRIPLGRRRFGEEAAVWQARFVDRHKTEQGGWLPGCCSGCVGCLPSGPPICQR